MVATISGQVITRTGRYREQLWGAWFFMTLSTGLMIMLDDRSNLAEQIIFLLLGALGTGPLFQTPLIALQAAMPLKDMAVSTGAFMFLRLIGGAIGISVSQAVISSTLREKLSHVSGFAGSAAAISQNVSQLKDIPDPVVRRAVIHAFARALNTAWIVMTPLCGLSLFLVLFIRHYTMKRTIVQEGKGNSAVTPTTPVAADAPQAIDEKQKRSASDLEKGLNGSEDGTADVKGEKDDTGGGDVKKA